MSQTSHLAVSSKLTQLVAAIAMTAAFWVPADVLAQVVAAAESRFPGPEPTSVWRGFHRPDATDSPTGFAVFSGKLRALGSNPSGLFEVNSTSAATLVLKNSVAPTGNVFRRFSRPSGNASGDVAFQARMSGGGRGVFLANGGSVGLVNWVGDVVPGGTGVMSRFSRAELSAAGDVVFSATISGGTSTEGLFRCSGGDMNCSTGSGAGQTLLLVGDIVDGREICDIHDNAIAASDWGVAVRTATRLSCADTAETELDAVIRKSYGGAGEVIALVGDASNPTPGAGGTFYLQLNGTPAISNSGVAAFIGHTGGLREDEVIFGCDPAACPAAPATVLASEGDTDGSGHVVSRKFQSVGISDVGDISFHASSISALGKRGTGVYVKRAGASLVEKVAFKSDLVTGASAPAVYARVYLSAMSPTGVVAFRSKIKYTSGGSAWAVLLYQ